jgi:hypothetical protein
MHRDRLPRTDPRNQFAYRVDSLADLDPQVGTALAEHLESGDPIHQIIVAPQQWVLSEDRHGWRPFLRYQRKLSPNWVLVVTRRQLLLATSGAPGSPALISATPLASLLALEAGAVLLFSWFDWTWANQGRLEHSRVYYNLVSDWIFIELRQYLSRYLLAPAGPPPAAGDRRLEILDKFPFKFMNIISYRMLLPEEQVRAAVFRAPVWTGWHGFFRRQKAAALALVLSNAHLLIMEEENKGATDQYSLITRFCPRRSICEIGLEREADQLSFRLTLGRPGLTESLRIPFDYSAEQDLGQLVAQLN